MYLDLFDEAGANRGLLSPSSRRQREPEAGILGLTRIVWRLERVRLSEPPSFNRKYLFRSIPVTRSYVPAPIFQHRRES